MSVSAERRGNVKPPSRTPRRVQRIDAVIIAALVLAAAGSAIGVMTYEDGRGSTLSVTWLTRLEEVSADPIAITGNDQGELTLNADLRNMTTATVRVTASGTLVRTSPTAILVEVTIPGIATPLAAEGTIPAGPPTSVTIEVPVTLGDVPTFATMRAGSPEAALAELDRAYGTDRGAGSWLVRVSTAPSAPGPLASEPYDVAAMAEIETFHAEVSVQTPEGPR